MEKLCYLWGMEIMGVQLPDYMRTQLLLLLSNSWHHQLINAKCITCWHTNCLVLTYLKHSTNISFS